MLSPIKLGRVQEVVVGLLGPAMRAGTTVLWSDQQVPREAMAGDLVVVNPIDGPSDPEVQGNDDRRTVLLPDVVTVTIANVADGKRYGLRLNGILYTTEADGVDTADTVRDRLVALVAADEAAADGIADQDTTTVATSAGEYTITPTELGGLWSLETFPEADHDAVGATFEPAEAIVGDREITLSIQAYSHNRSYRRGAGDMVARARAALRLRSSRTLFERHGIGVRGTPSAAINLTALSGPEFETRSQFSAVVSIRSVSVEAIDVIENVTAILAGRAPTTSTTVVVTTP